MDTNTKLRELIEAQLGSQILALCEAHAQIAGLQQQVQTLTNERDALLSKKKKAGPSES